MRKDWLGDKGRALKLKGFGTDGDSPFIPRSRNAGTVPTVPEKLIDGFCRNTGVKTSLRRGDPSTRPLALLRMTSWDWIE